MDARFLGPNAFTLKAVSKSPSALSTKLYAAQLIMTSGLKCETASETAFGSETSRLPLSRAMSSEHRDSLPFALRKTLKNSLASCPFAPVIKNFISYIPCLYSLPFPHSGGFAEAKGQEEEP